MPTLAAIRAIHDQPFPGLVSQASEIHRRRWDPTSIQPGAHRHADKEVCGQRSTCCAQSLHDIHMNHDPLATRASMLADARRAQASGCKRYCMNLLLRSLAEGPGFGSLLDTLREVRAMGLEVCVCLRFISEQQARGLDKAGCEVQNIDPKPNGSRPEDSASLHALESRLADLQAMMEAGIQICFGFLLGLEGTREDRIRCLHTLAQVEVLPKAPPIHIAVTILGKLQADMSPVPATEALRLMATARILFPTSRIRLTTDRCDLSPKALALAFVCGASSISTGRGLMAEPEHGLDSDQVLLNALGMMTEQEVP